MYIDCAHDLTLTSITGIIVLRHPLNVIHCNSCCSILCNTDTSLFTYLSCLSLHIHTAWNRAQQTHFAAPYLPLFPKPRITQTRARAHTHALKFILYSECFSAMFRTHCSSWSKATPGTCPLYFACSVKYMRRKMFKRTIAGSNQGRHVVRSCAYA